MDIVEELRKDPENGTRRLESEYKGRLMVLARRLCGDEGDAEELVNSTFAEVVASIAKTGVQPRPASAARPSDHAASDDPT